MNSVELRQERAKLVAESRRMIDTADAEGRDLKAEEEEVWTKYNGEIDRLGKEIDKEERREHVAKLEDELKQSVRKVTAPPVQNRTVDDKCRRAAFRGWLKGGTSLPLSTEERDACERIGYSPYNPNISMRYASMSEGTSGSGQEWAVYYPGIAQYIDTALKTYGNWFNTSTVIPTFNGIQFKLPTTNDTAQSASIVSEGAALNPADMTSGSVTFNSYMYRTGIVFSLELLQDALIPDLEGYLAQQLAIRFWRGLNTDFTTGNGTTAPQGITVGATDSGVTMSGSGSSASITADNLQDMIRAVDPLYRNGRCGFVMHDKTLGAIRKLKDANNQYLWTTSGGFSNALGQPDPDKIWGYPVYVNNAMPQVGTATNVVAVFGDLSKYTIRKVMEIQLQRLSELYILNGQLALVGFARFDGKIVDAGTHPIVKLINP